MHSLLSQHWHAVRNLRPRLKEGVQALPRQLRGRPWVMLHDPLTQRFVRITPQLWTVLRLLDGQRTLDEVWDAACALPAAPGAGESHLPIGQNELVQLLGQLYSNDLLQTQVSPDAGEVFERYEKQRKARLKQSLLNPMSLKVPLLYPDAWFSRQAGLARMMFTWGMLALWLLIVSPAALLAWRYWPELTNNLSDRVLSAHNLVLLWFTYPLVKAIHEWAHGMAVKAWGGHVREIGLMLVLFTPVPYVDATSSYRFPSKWARAAVAAAGIMAELLVGALALYVWMMAESGLVKAFAFNVVLISGVSTLVVNGNPLMRYDGYFVLCDLLELPNLSQRATQYWTYLSDRFLFRAKEAQPPLGSEGEQRWLFFYGLFAPVYRIFVSIGLIWFVAGEYFFLGILMALGSAWMSLVMPLWKGWKHVHEGPTLGAQREQAKSRLIWVVLAVLALLCVVPVPFNSVHEAVVWLPEEAIVRAEIPGHVVQVGARAEQPVTAGQALVRSDNPELVSEWEVAAAASEALRVRIRQAEVEDQTKAASLRQELQAAEVKEVELARQVQAQMLNARAAGRWTPAAPTRLEGRYLQRGEVVGYVLNGPSSLLRVAVTQDDMDLIRSRLQGVEARLARQMAERVTARVSRQVPGGTDQLVSAALGSNGGGAIAVDPSQNQGTKALQRVFDLEVEMAHPAQGQVFGDRAYVRFDLGWTPLAWQWTLRLRQLFLARFYV